MSARERIVVVGNGMAGARLVDDLLAADPRRPGITVIGEEPDPHYNRIMLSRLLSGDDHEDDIVLHGHDWYERRGVALHRADPAVALDRARQQVRTRSGARIPYDRVVLATGSRAAVPVLPGIPSDQCMMPWPAGIFVFRTMADTRSMLAHAAALVGGTALRPRAVVIGGGLLGIEAAFGLSARGMKVDLVHSQPHLMNQQLDATAASVLQRRVQAAGIRVHLGARTKAVQGEGHVEAVLLADGRSLAATMLVFATGIAPNTELAAAAGLSVRRGIVVDDRLTSVDDPVVHAVGECAEHRGTVYGLVAPAWDQARVLAARLSGLQPDAHYEGSRPVTRLKVAGLPLASVGLSGPETDDDEVVAFSEPRRGIHKSLVIRGDRLVGATLIGDVDRAAALTQAFLRGSALPEDRARLLFELAGPGASQDVATMPGDTQVCNCNAVTKGALVAAAASGATTREVMDRTRAGRGCGSCRLLVAKVVEHVRPPES